MPSKSQKPERSSNSRIVTLFSLLFVFLAVVVAYLFYHGNNTQGTGGPEPVGNRVDARYMPHPHRYFSPTPFSCSSTTDRETELQVRIFLHTHQRLLLLFHAGR